MRFNKGKTEFDLLYFPFIEEMAKVMMFGMLKGYERNNWKNPIKNMGDLDNSRLRHCISGIDEFIDPESKLSHMAHEAINAMFKYYHIKNAEKKN